MEIIKIAPKAPRSIDKQRKTSNLNGLLVFLIWSGIRESNPPILLGKQVFYQ